MNTLGQRVRAARKAKGLTMEQLAKAIGVTKGLVAAWEADQVKEILSLKLIRLADFLEVSARWIAIGGETPMTAPIHVDHDEHQLVMTYRALPKQAREVLLDKAIEYLQVAGQNAPSRLDPYPRTKKTK